MAKEKEAFETKAYRIYVTDSLRALIGNKENPHYTELIDRTVSNEDNAEQAKEIIDRIKNKLKGGG